MCIRDRIRLDRQIEVFEIQRKHVSENERLIAKVRAGEMDDSTARDIAQLQAEVKNLTNLRDNTTKLTIAGDKRDESGSREAA